MAQSAGMKALCVAFLLSGVSGARAQGWTAAKLNSSAVTNEAGAMIVLGTAGSYGDVPTATKEAAYDGNTATYFDPPAASAQNAWAGFGLQSPKVVTRVRYVGRSGQAARMNGVLFQGANTADFSDAVTLHTHTPPANWTGTTWIDVTLNTSTNVLRSFTYVRFIGTAAGSYGGNMAECEFYGADAPPSAPSVPAVSFADSANWYAHIRWTNTVSAMVHEVQRRRADEADFVTVFTNFYATGNTTWRDPVRLFNDTVYRLRARNSAGDSDWFTFTAAARNAATGTWIGVAGSYNNNGMTGEKVYDANIDTFFDGPNASSGNGLWAGLDLGEPRTVTGLRFTPRPVWASRMTGGQFHAADNPDFTGAVTLHTIAVAPHYTNMVEVTLASPATYRYVRYLSPNNGWGNVAEVEFGLAPSAPKAPLGLAVSSSDITNDFPVLAWSFDAPNVVSSSVVYRATAPGGPYAAVTPEGVFGRTWTDTTPTVGVLYYYKVSALSSGEDGSVEGPLSAYVSHRRCERLERTWEDNTTLKAGMSAFRIGALYNNDPNLSEAKLFDGSVSTFADITPSNCVVGINFGKPYGVGKVRFSPRSAIVGRANNVIVYGSNDLASATGLAVLSNAVANAYTMVSTTNSGLYRYVGLTKLVGEFYGNLSELEFYGWDPDTVSGVLTAPSGVSFVMQGTVLQVSWAAGANATSYRVERMPADGSSTWEEVGTTSATSLEDTAPAFGVRYQYRVVSLRTVESVEESAYSDSHAVIAYVPGSGTGLKGHYFVNYTKAYDPAESQVVARVDATVDFNWGTGPIVSGVPASATNVLVVWNGRLIVPHSGTYTFYASTDDGVVLRIGGAYVFNDWAGGASTRSGSVALAAGEHDIRIDYYQGTGGSYARLEWDGAVLRETVPASQLIPLDLPSEDIGPWRGRSFNAPRLGFHAYDAGSGGITVGSYGLDLTGTSEGHHFVWQQIGGPFLLEAKVTQQVDAAALSAKALLMVRKDLTFGSVLLAPARMATGQYGCKGRLTPGGNITDLLSPAWQGPVTNPCRLRIKRQGDTFTCQVMSEGGAWETFYTFTDSGGVFGSKVYAGFAVTSPTATTPQWLQTATFSDIRFTPLYGTVMMLH